MRAAHLGHHAQIRLQARQIRERVVVRLHVPLEAFETDGRVLPPRQRLFGDRVRHPIARADKGNVAVRGKLVPNGGLLRFIHAIALAKHKDHAHAAAARIAHAQLLANPQPPIKVHWRRDDADGHEFWVSLIRAAK